MTPTDPEPVELSEADCRVVDATVAKARDEGADVAKLVEVHERHMGEQQNRLVGLEWERADLVRGIAMRQAAIAGLREHAERIAKSIREGEEEMASGGFVTLDEAVGDGGDRPYYAVCPESETGQHRGRGDTCISCGSRKP